MQLSKRAKKIIAIVLVFLAINLAVDFVITKIVYDSIFVRYEDSDAKPICETVDHSCESIEFISRDNLLSGWLFEGDSDSLVVIAQGLNSVASYFSDETEYFLDEGYSVFIFDMTGSGDSSGDSSVGFSQAVYDLSAALDHIEEKYEYDDVFLFGHSRGAYASLCMLSERTDIAGVVSVNGANSAMEAIMASSKQRVGALAYGNYPMLWAYQTYLFDAEKVSASCADIIGRSAVPVLVIQAEDDKIVPYNDGSVISHREEIYRNGVEFMTVSGGHSAVLESNSELMNDICEFFEECKDREVSE